MSLILKKLMLYECSAYVDQGLSQNAF